MTTLAVRFDAALSGSDVTVRVDAQAAQLAALADAIVRLGRGELPQLAELERTVGALPMPDIRMPADFAAGLDAVRASVPADFSGILEGLLAQVQSLRGSLEGFTAPLMTAVTALEAIADLTSIDLSCVVSAGNGGSPRAAAPVAVATGAAGTTLPADTPAATAATVPPADPAAPTPVVAGIRQIHDALGHVPSPLDVATLLGLLNELAARSQFDHIIARPVPYLHEFRDTLATLVRWRTAPGAAIAADMTATVNMSTALIRRATAERVAAVAIEIEALGATLETDALAADADALTAGFDALRAALAGGDPAAFAAAVAAAATAFDGYVARRDALRALDLQARVAALRARLTGLPDELEDELTHALSVLRPDGALGELDLFRPPPREAQPGDDAFRAIEAKLGAAVVWVHDVLRKVDPRPFTEEVERVEAAVSEAAAALDGGILAATLEVQALFDRLDAQLAAIDTAALLGSVEAAGREFAASLTTRLRELLETVRDAVADALATAAREAGTFDPGAVIEALRQAIQSLASVLDDPSVRQVADQVRAAIETAERQLAAVSFAPVADEVIRGIEAIGAELDRIDETKLNGALRAALDAALSVLPPSIQPVTGALTVELSGVIEAGPVPALHAVQERLRASLEQVRRFEPAALVGDALARPYRELVGQLDGFTPARVLDPARDRLASFRQRVQTQANPGAAIAPLEPPFAALLRTIDRLDPDVLVRPVEEGLATIADAAITPVLGALDTVLTPVADMVVRVRAAADAVVETTALMRRLQGILTGLVDAEAQTRGWVDGIVDRIGALSDTPELRAAVGRLDDAFEAAAATRIEGTIADATRALGARLDTLRASSRLTALVQARRGIDADGLRALPDSPSKRAAATLLESSDPFAPVFGAHLRALAELGDTLAATPATIHTGLDGWDARYLGPDGAAACLRGLDVTPANVRAWVAAELETRFTRPVVAVLVRVETLQRLLAPLLTILDSLATALSDALAALLAAPEAALRVRGRVDTLGERVRGLGGDVLRERLGAVFADVRDKLDAVSPARLRALVEEQFAAVLVTLDVDAALPDLAVLDVEYEKLVAKVHALDPERLVIDVVQPEFEATLKPLIDSFDITGAIELLIRRLQRLDEELNAELERVDEAYRKLLRAAPGGGMSGSISVSIGA